MSEVPIDGPPGDIEIDPIPVPMPVIVAQAPAWAMAAQALDARDEPHLSDGLHLRVVTSPLLGLPVTPFRILHADVSSLTLRADIVWTDDNTLPTRLNPPFDVTPERPAIGWLPPAADATCCWIALDADVSAGEELRLSAMVSTGRGPRAVAARSDRPHRVWASAIEHIRVEGTGTINGVHWLPSTLAGGGLIRLMALPVARPHPRYAALDTGVLVAAARVTRGAPRRRTLHDTPGAPRPVDTPALPIPVEVARVGRLAEVVQTDLLRLVDEQILDPWLLSTVDTVVDERNEPIGTSSSNCLDTVLNGTVDHGLARWLGFLDNDDSINDDGALSARIVTAVFAPDWAALEDSELLFSIPPGALVADLPALQDRYPDFDALGDLDGTVTGPFLDIGVMAAFSPGRPFDVPRPPVIVSVTDRPTRTSDVEVGPVSVWLPRTPPDAARETRVVVDDLQAGAALAFARDDLAGNGPVVLNGPSAADGFTQPLVAAVTVVDDGAADRGSLGDRSCPAGAVRYHVAQVDWFGRWSDWAGVDLADGVRPQPPVPAVRAWATQPDVADDDEGGPLGGRILATVAVPAPGDLPPGANLLTGLRFQVTDAASDTTTTNIAIADPTAPPAELPVDVAGPALMPGTSTTVTVSAHVTDTADERSAPSPDLHLTIWDPRPPPPVVIDPSLRYTARPDVAGLARVDLTWSAASPQDRFRVYHADETTLQVLVASLAEGGDSGAGSLLGSLAVARDIVERGVAWTAHAAVLPRDAFTLITPSPLLRVGSQTRLEHTVSGSLRGLSLYRVVAVSLANVDAEFAASPVVPYAVPNTLPPPQPHVVVRILDPATTGAPNPTAELTVTVPRGSRRAVEYRLRRSRVSAADPLLMPVVGSGGLHPPADPPVDPDTGVRTDPPAPHVEIVTDLGPTTIEPGGVLRPWNIYTWRVEVRGEPEPGGGPPGAWSQPSMPAGASVVPLSDPPAPSIATLERRGAVVAIAIDVPADLRGGALGTYRVELYRQRPGERELLLAGIDEQQRPDGPGPWPFVDDGLTGEPVSGTTYRAVIVDPRGRHSLPSPTRSVP